MSVFRTIWTIEWRREPRLSRRSRVGRFEGRREPRFSRRQEACTVRSFSRDVSFFRDYKLHCTRRRRAVAAAVAAAAAATTASCAAISCAPSFGSTCKRNERTTLRKQRNDCVRWRYVGRLSGGAESWWSAGRVQRQLKSRTTRTPNFRHLREHRNHDFLAAAMCRCFMRGCHLEKLRSGTVSVGACCSCIGGVRRSRARLVVLKGSAISRAPLHFALAALP